MLDALAEVVGTGNRISAHMSRVLSSIPRPPDASAGGHLTPGHFRSFRRQEPVAASRSFGRSAMMANLMSSTQKPWEHAKSGGSEHDALAARFVESLSYDTRLYKHDIAGSIAHARMLQHVGLISADELSAIERGLGEIQNEIEAAQVTGWPGWRIELEDVHMCIEAALIEKIGDPGRKLHTGRSRNDQVATDIQLWIECERCQIRSDIERLIRAFIRLAIDQGDIVIPSYTHLQRAQPIVVGGEAGAWKEAFERCRCRFENLSFDYSPLGSGAIAGSSLPLDREFAAKQMRIGIMDLVTDNSIESTASRDNVLDFAYALSMTSMWLSRWAEQWIIYMTAEFGTLSIGDAFTTGSSMMPQKRNPDMLELIRGRCGNVYGHLVALLTICKGITIGYNRDLQEDKRHVFAAYDTVRDCLQMATAIVKSAKFKSPDMSRGFMDATSLAEYLVTKGVPFRTAHQVVGSLVRHCIENNITQLSDLSVDQMNRLATPLAAGSPPIDKIVYDWLGAENVVKRYQTYGNAGLSGYRQQLDEWKKRLGGHDESPAPEKSLFGEDLKLDDHDAALIAAYEQAGRTLDDLPYTDEFEAIYKSAAGGRDRSAVFHRLHNLRKAGKLPKLGRTAQAAPLVTDEQQTILIELVTGAIGKLSLRDQLPFTDQFPAIVDAFNARTGLQFSPYQVWRVVAKLAK
ncbi:MAG: argininosuccinate lyase [Planctomycetes bacterium]|nr:argininosuccinate lyase [Planctomycetota bacterium]